MKLKKIKPKTKGEKMIGNLENINSVVDLKVYSKPQDIIKQLLSGEFRLLLQTNTNKKLVKRLCISSVNNSSYNPIIGV